MSAPLTLADLTGRVYGKWSGNPKGYPFRADQCCMEVGGNTSWGPANARQCGRKPGHGPNGLYCRQHATTAPGTLAENGGDRG